MIMHQFLSYSALDLGNFCNYGIFYWSSGQKQMFPN